LKILPSEINSKDFEMQTKVSWVQTSSSVWAPTFTTYIREDYQPEFHPSAFYKNTIPPENNTRF